MNSTKDKAFGEGGRENFLHKRKKSLHIVIVDRVDIDFGSKYAWGTPFEI